MSLLDSILGKSLDDIAPIIENIVGTRISAISVSFKHQVDGHPGYQGKKLIPTFEFTTNDGDRQKLNVFIKRHDEPERIESDQFLHAHKHGAPIPEFYHSLRDNTGREVLFIEHLPVIFSDGAVYSSPDLLRRFVRLIARVNAIPVSEDYASLPHHGSVHLIPLAQLDPAERLSDSLAREMDLASMLKHLSDVVSAFPLGFVHGDFWPHHTGARGPDDEMLAIDLGLALHASRFFDIAPFVGTSFDLPALALTRDQIAEAYLEAYQEYGGNWTGSKKDFLAEVDAVWLAWNSRVIGRAADVGTRQKEEVRCHLHTYLEHLRKWKEGEQPPAPRTRSP